MRKFKYNHPANCGYSLDKVYGYDELSNDLTDEQIEIMFVELIGYETVEAILEEIVDIVKKK